MIENSKLLLCAQQRDNKENERATMMMYTRALSPPSIRHESDLDVGQRLVPSIIGWLTDCCNRDRRDFDNCYPLTLLVDYIHLAEAA